MYRVGSMPHPTWQFQVRSTAQGQGPVHGAPHSRLLGHSGGCLKVKAEPRPRISLLTPQVRGNKKASLVPLAP